MQQINNNSSVENLSILLENFSFDDSNMYTDISLRNNCNYKLNQQNSTRERKLFNSTYPKHVIIKRLYELLNKWEENKLNNVRNSQLYIDNLKHDIYYIQSFIKI